VSEQVGIVVIGRNEGERLMRCLESVRGRGLIVYVDSGSTDGSVTQVRALGTAPKKSLALPVEETPTVPNDPPAQWVSVRIGFMV